jgi:histidinol-phosphate aminotransferase
MSYERAHIRKMHGYVPGKQPTDPAAIKLNTNENPYPPSPSVMAALGAIAGDALRKYPPPLADPFREVAARLHGVELDQVMAVNGGDELLRLAVSTFVEPGQAIGMLEPSYSLYPVLAELHDSPLVTFPLEADWSVPEGAAQRLFDARVALTFLVSPHAPSGTLVPVDRVRALANTLPGVLLVDEAYVDFVDPALGHDVVALVRELPNVLILRTLSKGYSLAGLRCGYALGARELIAPMLTKTRDSYNLDLVAQRLGAAALSDQAYARESWRKVREERARLREALRSMGLESPASQSNFLLVQVPGGPSQAVSLLRGLEARGLLVRYFGDDPRLEDKLRITVGTPEQNHRLVEALRELLSVTPA